MASPNGDFLSASVSLLALARISSAMTVPGVFFSLRGAGLFVVLTGVMMNPKGDPVNATMAGNKSRNVAMKRQWEFPPE